MGSSPEALSRLAKALTEVPGSRWRKMFGEAAVYYDDKVVALFCDDRFFLRVTDQCEGQHWETGTPYPGAKDHWIVPARVWTDPDVLAEVLAATASATPAPKPKKPRRQSQA